MSPNTQTWFSDATRRGVVRPTMQQTWVMLSFPSVLATVTASDELPEIWGQFAFAAFILGCLLSCVVLTASLAARRRSAWFLPTTFAAMIFGLAGLAFAAYVYRIDYHAVEIDGTKASPPVWQALAIPSLPFIASLAAFAVYRRRSSPT
ncbi:MAG: hypothetical protein V4662_04395 [Verrucomicrobiota bacterium]